MHSLLLVVDLSPQHLYVKAYTLFSYLKNLSVNTLTALPVNSYLAYTAYLC